MLLFIVQFNNRTFNRAQIEAQSINVALHFNRVPVYHRIKFITEDPYTAGGPEDSVVDSIHVQPAKSLRSGKKLPGRFDTALVNDGSGGLTGVGGKWNFHTLPSNPQMKQGYRVGQVRVVFFLKSHHIKGLFVPGISPPQHLAYVEWFSSPDPHHLMYKVKRSIKDGDRLASIVPLANIRRSIHLLPKFGPVAPPHWTSAK
ncbi:hypothetical protein B0H14DRAFT_2422579 [Mycena olivaceomarginata]|nr:hypothetical protein B0H14DRAFT_2422579 [Mycena olivaceomarginata]